MLVKTKSVRKYFYFLFTQKLFWKGFLHRHPFFIISTKVYIWVENTYLCTLYRNWTEISKNCVQIMFQFLIFNDTDLWGTICGQQIRSANMNTPFGLSETSNFLWNFLPGFACKLVSRMIWQDLLSHWLYRIDWGLG